MVGLTCRIGRAVFGTIAIVRDLIESGESILLLGRHQAEVEIDFLDAGIELERALVQIPRAR